MTDSLLPIAPAAHALEPLQPVGRYARHARSDRTLGQYRSACALFEQWCRDRGRAAMPAKAETVVAWAEWLADGNKAPSTVNAYVAAVASAHRLAGHPFNRAQMGLQDTLAGIRRVNARATREA